MLVLLEGRTEGVVRRPRGLMESETWSVMSKKWQPMKFNQFRQKLEYVQQNCSNLHFHLVRITLTFVCDFEAIGVKQRVPICA